MRFCGVPINQVLSFNGGVVVASPPELGDGILDNAIEVVHRGMHNLVGPMPELPRFLVDREFVGHRNLRRRAHQMRPVSFGQLVHVNVETGKPGQRVVTDMIVLVTFDMSGVPDNGDRLS